jgi:hypothetical protein
MRISSDFVDNIYNISLELYEIEAGNAVLGRDTYAE